MKNQKLAGSFFVQTVQEKGEQGPRGMLPYPAGEYSSGKTYVATANITPYILLNGSHYVMNKIGSWMGASAGKTPAQDYATNGVNATWIPFEEFKAIFVEILMARLGLIGAAVFYDDFMFSQHGVDANGNSISDYSGFASGTFIPNILFNLKNGEGHFAGGNYRWDAYGYTYRKSRERIIWRKLQQEIENAGVPSVYNIDLKRGTYLDINTGYNNFIAKLPRPEDAQNAIIDTRYSFYTRSSYSVKLVSDGVIRWKETGSIVTQIFGRHQKPLVQTPGVIESVSSESGGWEWQFYGDGLSGNP